MAVQGLSAEQKGKEASRGPGMAISEDYPKKGGSHMGMGRVDLKEGIFDFLDRLACF